MSINLQRLLLLAGSACVAAVASPARAQSCGDLGSLFYLGNTQGDAQSIWLSQTRESGAFRLEAAQQQRLVDRWSAGAPNLRLSLSDTVSNGSGGTHRLFVEQSGGAPGNSDCLIDTQNQQLTFELPPVFQRPPGKPDQTLPNIPPSGVMPERPPRPPAGNAPGLPSRPDQTLPTVPPSGVMPERPPLPPSGVTPGLPSRPDQTLPTVPPSGVMPERPVLPPSGIAPGLPSRPDQTLPTVPPSGVMPERPPLPPSGITPGLPSRPDQTLPTVPPSGVMPERPPLPPSGVTPGLPSRPDQTLPTVPPNGVMPERPPLPPSGVTPGLPSRPDQTLPTVPPSGVMPERPTVPPAVGPAAPPAPDTDIRPLAPASDPCAENQAYDGTLAEDERRACDPQYPTTDGRRFLPKSEWNVWGSLTSSNLDREENGFKLADGSTMIASFGFDRALSDEFVLGVSAMYSEGSTTSYDGLLESDIEGFSIGPYLAWRFASAATLNLSASWGQVDNRVRLIGLESDFETQVLSIAGDVTFDAEIESVALRPRLSLSYTRSENEDHVFAGFVMDRQVSVALAGRTSELGSAEAALEAAVPIALKGDNLLVPFLESGVKYDFLRPDNPQLDTSLNRIVSPGEWSGYANAGLRLVAHGGFMVEVSGAYRSLGVDDFDIWEGRLYFSLAF